MRAKLSPEFEAIAFDFAKNLPVPNKSSYDCYYKRQLSFYTFNFHVLSTDEVFLYTYDETVAKKGPDDVCSMIMHYIQHYLSDSVTELAFFCDGCSGQNKNYTVLKFIHHLVHTLKRFMSVKILFPIRGHSYLECGRDFANLNQKKNIDIPSQWRDELTATRQSPSPFIVIDASQDIFMACTKYFNDLGYYKATNPMKIRPVREIQIYSLSKNQQILYRVNWNGAFESVVITVVKKARKCSPLQLARSYTSPIPIKMAKNKDLQVLKNLCNPDCFDFYDHLPHTGVQVASNSNVTDSDSDTNEFSGHDEFDADLF